jgi:hypothetical protein
MSDPEKFLERWSRRKIEAEGDSLPADKPVTASKPAAAGDEVAKPAAARASEAASEPEFDLSSLPPIESIGADTDITGFLKPGVPSALRHAALRRVWVIDPAIRDFVGLQDYDWDFNSSDIAGFGEIGSEHDVANMVARLFGGEPADPPAASEQTASLAGESLDSDLASAVATRGESATAESQQIAASAVDKSLLQSAENTATQKDKSFGDLPQMKARRHGGALPQCIAGMLIASHSLKLLTCAAISRYNFIV